MATYSRVTPTGWEQGDDSTTSSRVMPTGWDQEQGVAAPATLIGPLITEARLMDGGPLLAGKLIQ